MTMSMPMTMPMAMTTMMMMNSTNVRLIQYCSLSGYVTTPVAHPSVDRIIAPKYRSIPNCSQNAQYILSQAAVSCRNDSAV